MAHDPNSEALSMLFDNKIYLVESEAKSEAEQEVVQAETVTSDSEATQSSEAQVSSQIEYLGENRKQVFMLFAGGAMPAWPTERKHTFLKILQSIGLEFNDIACCGENELQTKSLNALKEQLNTNYLFLWGVDPNGFGVACNQFEIASSDNMQVISLPPLTEVEADQNLKRQLWECIRNLKF